MTNRKKLLMEIFMRLDGDFINLSESMMVVTYSETAARSLITTLKNMGIRANHDYIYTTDSCTGKYRGEFRIVSALDFRYYHHDNGYDLYEGERDIYWIYKKDNEYLLLADHFPLKDGDCVREEIHCDTYGEVMEKIEDFEECFK